MAIRIYPVEKPAESFAERALKFRKPIPLIENIELTIDIADDPLPCLKRSALQAGFYEDNNDNG